MSVLESISYLAVAKALQQLIIQNYGEDEDAPLEAHFMVAEYLLERLENASLECQTLDENENTIGIFKFLSWIVRIEIRQNALFNG